MHTRELVVSEKNSTKSWMRKQGRTEVVELREQYLVRFTDLLGRYTEETFDGVGAAEKRQRELIRDGLTREGAGEPEVWQVVR